jgi:3-mercaptopropionate dioxygenase
LDRLQASLDLSDFIREMTKVIDHTKNHATRVKEAEHLLSQLIRSKTWLSQEKFETGESGYARHSLYRDTNDQFEVLALVWNPGQRTPLHDHDGTWGVEGVISGRMKVMNYVQLDSFPDRTVKLCYAGAMTLNEQSTGELLPPADCHILEALEPTITIHVYGKRLRKFRIFDPVPNAEKGLYTFRENPVGYTTE